MITAFHKKIVWKIKILMRKGRLSLDIHDNIKLYFSSFMVLDVRKRSWTQEHVKLHKVVFLSVYYFFKKCTWNAAGAF